MVTDLAAPRIPILEGRAAEAEAVLQATSRVRRTTPCFELGVNCMNTQRLREAADWLCPAIELDPEFAEAHAGPLGFSCPKSAKCGQ